MTLPLDTEALPPSGAVTRLPSLGSPELSTEYLARIKEILESMLGRRGNEWDRVVTFRDLHALGLRGGGGGNLVINMGEATDLGPGYGNFVSRVQAEIENSAAFKNLKRRIGSAEDLAHLPDEIKRQLQLELGALARSRRADIQSVEQKIQTVSTSMASRLVEFTASLEQASAGVRNFDAAYADRIQAIALKVTQLTASLEGVGAIDIEERLEAIASAIDGLQGQWSMKIQTNPIDGSNPIIAGIALSVEDPIAGPGTSSLIFMAEKFGFFTQNGSVMPFGIGSDGNVYISTQLRVGNGGTTLANLTDGVVTYVGAFASAPDVTPYGINDVYKNTTDGNTYILTVTNNIKSWSVWLQSGGNGLPGANAKSLSLSATSQIFQITKAGANAPASITFTATAQNTAGSPNFTIPVGSATLAPGADAYSKVLNFAAMTSDTVTIQVAQDGLTDRITIVKVREGADGANAIVPILTNEAANVAAGTDGTVGSFSGTGGTFRILDGLVDVTGTAAVTYSVFAESGVDVSIAASGVYSISSMSADTGSATLRAVYKGLTLDKIYSISKSKTGATGATTTGPTGPRGTVEIAVATSGTGWSSAEANVGLVSAGYGAPKFMDIVTLYNTAAKFAQSRFWDGDSWEPMAAYINGNLLVPGTVAADRIIANGLVLRGVSGNALVGEGVPLDPSLAAAGTKNSELATAISSAATTANWPSIGGTGKPQDNATVGADASNLKVGIGGGNFLSANSLPTSTTGLTVAGYNMGVTVPVGPVYAAPGSGFGAYSPFGMGSTYMYVAGTPPASAIVDKYRADRVRVVAGNRYEFSVALSTNRCKSQIRVSWYDATGINIGQDAGNLVDRIAATYPAFQVFPRSFLLIAAPPGAVEAMIFVRQSHDGIDSECYTFASQWYFGEALLGQATASPWSDAPAVLSANTAAAAAAAAAKLNKNAADILQGSIALQAGGAIIVGTLTADANGYRTGGYGVGITQRGMVAYSAAGVLTFQLDFAGGNPYFAGQLSAAYGTFGSVSVAVGGSISSGQTAYNTGAGFWLGGAGDPKFSIRTANGATFLCDPANNVLAMNGGSIGGTTTIDTFTVTIPAGNITGSGAAGYQPYGSRTVTVSGPTRGALTYSWMIFNGDSANGYADSRIIITDGSDTSVVTLAGTAGGPNGSDVLIGELICLVTDASGLSKSAKVGINRVHGSGAA